MHRGKDQLNPRRLCGRFVLLLSVAMFSGLAQENLIKMPILVDGSKTPEQIPDQIAYRHFIAAIAERRNASSAEQARRNSQIRLIGLSDDDKARLITELLFVREQLDKIDQSTATTMADLSLTPQAKAEALTFLKSQRQGVKDTAVVGVHQVLSASGWAQLDLYVKGHVKPHIVIYGTPHVH